MAGLMSAFAPIRSLLKIEDVCIDNAVFRLHYKATLIILAVFSLIISLRQYVGDPIDCIVDSIPLHIMDTYCWVTSTFTIPSQLIGVTGQDNVQPGVGTHVPGKDDEKYHKYYQWVGFFLVFQANLFYVPRYLWKIWEGGRMKAVVSDLKHPILNDECKAKSKQVVLDYFRDHIDKHNTYAFRFFFCEVLNFVNVVGQIFFIDFFLAGEFSTYGIDVLKFIQLDQQNRTDPMIRIFPRVTKCTFRKYGPSGSIQIFDGLCVLPVNIVNEKIFVFLWFWLFVLALVTSLSLGYRLAVFCSPRFRVLLLQARARMVKRNDLEKIVRRCKVSDWFVLYQLARNIDRLHYNEILVELAAELAKDVEYSSKGLRNRSMTVDSLLPSKKPFS